MDAGTAETAARCTRARRRQRRRAPKLGNNILDSAQRTRHPPTLVDPENCLAFSDLGIGKAPVPCRSSQGTPFVKWVPTGMPKLPPESLDCVCYLYDSEADAKAGEKFGGTAFLVAVPSRLPNRAFFYAVTNWHIACRGTSVLRVNTHDGKGDIFDFGPDYWVFDPRFDIAVAPLTLDNTKHKFKLIPLHGLATKEDIARHEIGSGENVFMMGRFVDHDGGPVNQPAVRFGHISVMPTSMEQPNRKFADAYCIDVHSRSGYSGSPVFVYRTPGDDLSEALSDDVIQQAVLLAGTHFLILLGIHFAQFSEEWEIVVDSRLSTWFKKRLQSLGIKSEAHKVPLIKRGAYVQGLSGMTCVLPAWNIIDVLNHNTLKRAREYDDAAEESRLRDAGKMPPAPESRT